MRPLVGQADRIGMAVAGRCRAQSRTARRCRPKVPRPRHANPAVAGFDRHSRPRCPRSGRSRVQAHDHVAEPDDTPCFAATTIMPQPTEITQFIFGRPLEININAFKTPFPENIQSKTFVNCEIYGPAVLLFNGYTTLDRGGMFSCDFVKVKTGKEHPIYNAIAFENITLRNCRLFNMTVLIPDYLVGSIPSGANWITP